MAAGTIIYYEHRLWLWLPTIMGEQLLYIVFKYGAVC